MTTFTGGYTRTDAQLVLHSVLGFVGLHRQPRRQHARRRDSRWPTLIVHYVVAAFTWSRDAYGVDASALGRGWRVVVGCVTCAACTWFGIL